MRKVWGPIVNRRQTYEVTVSAAELAALILAVHEAAGQSGGPSARRWRHGNVVGISTPRVRDLPLATVRAKHVVARRPVAAITAALHRTVAVDVIFTLDDDVACAQFHCATTHSEITLAQERTWAEYLSTKTSAALIATGITTSLSAGYVCAAEAGLQVAATADQPRIEGAGEVRVAGRIEGAQCDGEGAR